MLTEEESYEFIELYRKNWVGFIEDVCEVKTWSAMNLVCDSVMNNKRTSVRACHGISKTYTAAAIAIAFYNLYFPCVVLTTAPTGNQVKNLLWKEIGNIYSKRGDFLIGKCDMQQIREAPDWYMLGFSTDRPYRAEGFHSENILWILDEAKGMEGWMYDAVEGSLTGGFSRVLELSTTDGADQQCRFRQHHESERTAWNCIHLSSFDSPFVDSSKHKKYSKFVNRDLFKYGKPKNGTEWNRKFEKKIQIVTSEYIKDQEKLWKKKRPELWETKILGEFSTSGENNLIPLAWVKSAVNAEVDDIDSSICHGLDVARMGTDKSVLTTKTGKLVQPQEVWGKKNTMQTVGIVRNFIDANDLIKVDANGLGAGVFDRLAELLQPTIGLDSAASAFDDVKFANLKAEMWWCAREIFEQQYEEGNIISIPDDPELIEDLTGMKYNIRSNGKIIVEDKKEFKKRLGRSPDQGDSCVYCLYEMPVMAEEYYEEGEADIFL